MQNDAERDYLDAEIKKEQVAVAANEPLMQNFHAAHPSVPMIGRLRLAELLLERAMLE